MAQIRSRHYEIGLIARAASDNASPSDVGDITFYDLANVQAAGFTLAAPTAITQRDFVGARGARRTPGNTTWTVTLDGLEYDSARLALYDANRIIAASTQVLVLITRNNVSWIGEVYPEPIDITSDQSGAVNTVSATLTGRKWLYGGPSEDTIFTAAQTAAYSLASKPAAYTGATRGDGLWVVRRGGSAAATATFEIGGGSTDSATFPTAPGATNVAELGTQPAGAWDELQVSGAIGTDTPVRIIYGHRVGAPLT